MDSEHIKAYNQGFAHGFSAGFKEGRLRALYERATTLPAPAQTAAGDPSEADLRAFYNRRTGAVPKRLRGGTQVGIGD